MKQEIHIVYHGKSSPNIHNYINIYQKNLKIIIVYQNLL